MFTPLSNILIILEYYKYWLIFPIAIIEGPIIIIISGFLVYLGYLNPYVAYVILVAADMIGDSLYFTLGKYWRRWLWIKKYARFLGYDEKSEEFLENHFKKHKVKTLLISKISHGVGSTIQISAGIAGIDFLEFLSWSFIGTTIKTSVLMFVGYYVGSSYEMIDGYLDYIAMFTIGLLIFMLGYVLLSKYVKNFLKKDEEME